MNVVIPELCLVALVGPSSSGKSTFAAEHFLASEVLSSDAFRLMLADDENDQAITPAAFEALHFVAGKRLDGGRLTVVDATNLQPHAREELVRLARQHHVLPVAIAAQFPGNFDSESFSLSRRCRSCRPGRLVCPSICICRAG